MKNFALNYEGNNIVAYNKLLFESFPLALFDSPRTQNNTDQVEKRQGRGGIRIFGQVLKIQEQCKSLICC